MSYCRWSTDDFRCDLYIYENVSGCWTIHVAGNRLVECPPKTYEYPEEHKVYQTETRNCFSITREGADAWQKWEEENNKRETIALPYAGETFDLASPGECADKVEELTALGYCVPDYVAVDLREDQAALASTTAN